jgi:hypothetical protein
MTVDLLSKEVLVMSFTPRIDRFARTYMVIERHDAVDMIVSATENGGPAGSADTVGHVTVVKEHALLRETVNIRRVIDPSTVGTD